jgi:hypothetical protein
MIVAVSTIHFGRQTRLPTHKDKREFRNASRAVAPYKHVCAANFPEDSALLIFVDGSPSQGTTKNCHISLYT